MRLKAGVEQRGGVTRGGGGDGRKPENEATEIQIPSYSQTGGANYILPTGGRSHVVG